RRITIALTILTGKPRKAIRIAAIAVFFYPILYPISAMTSFALCSRSVYQQSTLNDWFFAYPFWIGIVISAQLAMGLILIDLLLVSVRVLYKKGASRLVRVHAVLTVAIAGVLTLYSAGRIYADTWTVRSWHKTVYINDLPENLNGLRIVQITDLHADPRTEGRKLQAYIDRANSLNPDLIVFCGDLVSSGTSYIQVGAAALGKLRARYGVFACLGDHDFFSDPQAVTRSLNDQGITVLRDAMQTVQIGASTISLTGLTNVYRSPARPDTVALLTGSRPHTSLDIFFTHQPSNWLVPIIAAAGYDLMLAGHTHGGQIAFPFPGFILTGSSFETHYVTGFFDEGKMPLSICNGLGETLAPIRYQAPAEVTLIEIKGAQKSTS
ncbi:MAG: metallophosphoesterase, partial [Blastocatellia bacterium]